MAIMGEGEGRGEVTLEEKRTAGNSQCKNSKTVWFMVIELHDR